MSMQERINELNSLCRKNGRIYKSEFFKRQEGLNLHGGMLLGGTDDAERVAYFAVPDEYENFNIEEHIQCLRIVPNDKLKYTHRDYLGAIMALQIEREKLGDIIACKDCGYVVGFVPMITFLRDNLTNIGKTSCYCQSCSFSEISEEKSDMIEKNYSVSSMRLDCIVAACFQASREIAKQWIEKALVRVNMETVLRCEKRICIQDVISVKGAGRVQILQEMGNSRKGKIILRVKK